MTMPRTWSRRADEPKGFPRFPQIDFCARRDCGDDHACHPRHRIRLRLLRDAQLPRNPPTKGKGGFAGGYDAYRDAQRFPGSQSNRAGVPQSEQATGASPFAKTASIGNLASDVNPNQPASADPKSNPDSDAGADGYGNPNALAQPNGIAFDARRCI